MRLVGKVRDNFEITCVHRGSLRKEGCTVSLQGAPEPRLILDFDKPGSPLGPQDSRCDYLFVAEDLNKTGWLALLELMRGKLDVSKVVRQLTAGARAAEQLLPNAEAVNFRPIAAFGGGVDKAERRELGAATVRFRGVDHMLRRIKCGEKLTQGLQQ